MSWVEKLKEYGVSDEEFNKFCEKYPEFKSNRELMAKLYLVTVKGVKVAEPRITGEFTKVAELSVNVPSRIRVVAIQQVDKRSYVGCPKCLKKLQAAPNTTVECPRDGLVKAQVLEWNLVLAGDDTGEIMLSIPPSVGKVPNNGEVIAVEGVLTELDEFIVWRYSTAEAAVKPPIITVTAAPPVPVTAPTPTPTAAPTAAPPTAPVKAAEFKCPICGKSFKNTMALKIHTKTIHKMSLEEAEKAKAAKPAEKPVEKPAEVKPPETTVTAPTPAATTVTTPTTVEKPAEVKVEAKPTLPEEAVKLARVAATINKPFEEFKAFITGKFPGINIDELLKVAGVKVEEGVMKKL